VVRNWNQIKRDDERGGEIFGHIPETLPSTLYAKKILKRAESAGRGPDAPGPDVGERLLAAVQDAVEAGVDPELALRRAADRFREQVETG
jgi:nucleoside triphosphate diphosphatase